MNDETAADYYSEKGNSQTQQTHKYYNVDTDKTIGQHICFLIARAFSAFDVTYVQHR